MEGLTFRNNYIQNRPAQIQRRLESEENFTALDTEKLKQDTVEITNKATETVKENWFFRILRNTFGVNNPKKLLISIGLSIITVIGIAVFGNKMLKLTSKGGSVVDKFLLHGDNVFSRAYRSVSKYATKAKEGIGNAIKNSNSAFLKDFQETFKNRVSGPVNSMAKTHVSGGTGIFSLTPPDTIKTALDERSGLNKATKELSKFLKDKKGFFIKREGEILPTTSKTLAKDIKNLLMNGKESEALDVLKSFMSETEAQQYISSINKSKGNIMKSLNKLFEDNDAKNIFEEIFAKESKENMDNCELMFDALMKKFNLTKEEAVNFLSDNIKNKSGEFAEFVDVEMNKGGLIASWWPVNFINKAGRKIFKGKWKDFAKGDFFDSMLKYGSMKGRLAETLPGRIVQKSVIFPAEYSSNFVNDKSGLGVFLAALELPMLFNNVQDAPKEQKAATVANDFISTIGSVAITAPIASKIVTLLSTMKNLDGKGLAIIPKAIGKVIGMGRNYYNPKTGLMEASKNGFARFAGGALRFYLIMFVFMPMIAKPIQKAIQKVLGKPYDPAEAEKERLIEEQKKTIIPELNITQGELQERIEKNPDAIKKMRENPELTKAVDKNPKLLLDLLEGKEINTDEILKKPTSTTQSPMLQNMLKKEKSDLSNEADLFSSKNKEKKDTATRPKDVATYVPNSAFTAPKQELSPEIKNAYDRLMAGSDKILAEAEKFI